MGTTIFICQLPKQKQKQIRIMCNSYLKIEGYNEEEIREIIDNVMDERLCLLENILDVNQFL